MLEIVRIAFSALLLAVTTLTPGQADARQQENGQVQTRERPVIRGQVPEGARTGARPFVRTELYFGTARPDGVVTEEQFREFIDEHVTPRFRDGLTVIKADGQFRGENDTIVREQSFVVVLLHPYRTLADSSRRIERIRRLYEEQFDQQSVLRVDDPFVVWASF